MKIYRAYISDIATKFKIFNGRLDQDVWVVRVGNLLLKKKCCKSPMKIMEKGEVGGLIQIHSTYIIVHIHTGNLCFSGDCNSSLYFIGSRFGLS